jgi:hypothetical protein
MTEFVLALVGCGSLASFGVWWMRRNVRADEAKRRLARLQEAGRMSDTARAWEAQREASRRAYHGCGGYTE